MNHCSKNLEISIPDFGSIHLNVDPDKVSDYRDYFLMASRKNNEKRNFLFVSQLLGKHIPILPEHFFAGCKQLATQYAEGKGLKIHDGRFVCKKKTLFIGFAETATAMGHGVFEQFDGDITYVHTTRNDVKNYEFGFEFEEEHSHATQQLFFLEKENAITDAEEIVIIDDEVTTGNTILNIIKSIAATYPNKKYSVLSYLDWRNEASRHNYTHQKTHDISFHALLHGSIEDVNINCNLRENASLNTPQHYTPEDNNWTIHNIGIAKDTITNAEKGINTQQRAAFVSIVNDIKTKIESDLKDTERHIIGTGEFMYLPLMLADTLEGQNHFHATTRSPIIAMAHDDYGVKHSIDFAAFLDESRREYLHNPNLPQCKEVVLMIEDTLPIHKLYSLLSELDTCQFSSKHLVFVKS